MTETPSTSGTGPYETEQETYDSPLARAVQAAEPGRGVGAAINREHLASALEQAGVRLGAYDIRIVSWLSKWESSTVQVVIGLIARAYAAGQAVERERIAGQLYAAHDAAKAYHYRAAMTRAAGIARGDRS